MKAKVSRIDIYSANIPFRTSFKHTQKERRLSESNFVRIEMEGGQIGFGESLPRAYVTGESQQSVLSSLKDVLPRSLVGRSFGSFEEVVDFCASFEGLSGAAKCAFELALLDSAAKAFDCSVAKALGGIKTAELRYSAAIGNTPLFDSRWSALKFRLYGIKCVKLKVGDAGDTSRLKAVRQCMGKGADIRLDANCAWSAEEAIEKLTVMRDYNFSAIEQPVGRDDIGGLKRVSDAIPECVMADEGICDIGDAKRLVENKACDMFNIRISKCGGLLNSLKIAELAAQSGISFQLGCQVGETGILSAAGRHFASCVNGVKYLEGSYAKFLLERDIIKEDLSFGYGGRARPLAGRGLGITVDEKILERYSSDKVTIE